MIIRKVKKGDLSQILDIYNQGIQDRIATLEVDPKDQEYIQTWYENHQGRYIAIVAENYQSEITGWACISAYNARKAYYGVGEISVYIHKDFRGQKIGQKLLKELEIQAINNKFHKLVLFTFPFNVLGQGLYHKMGYREVGVFKNQGIIDGHFVDVMAMEKLIN
ncbi:arsinothricin resistance N-acetyltransferase ArsN1 family A [Heyndrickxia oleronia]|uniref:Arsinothricin resistance N-acetyltransferase ArsN1 n=1 Tax=Heyndrickxia oleronia TaxID=38875 RepID=A0AAW6T548_9BACI|nr:arsinothricin resistance N-acetyltransferase ArsN1 family A [Heyndrickxia oleronia]MDH5163416.1 arsinothricin resistance N-acetyltransferase ArsN1 [Heyndrickxia oleronia]